MIRSVSLLISLAVSSAPAGAASYAATLATPAPGRIIARDIVWSCGAAACHGATDNSRPVVLCQSLAKQAGRVDRFLIDGRDLGPAELERCNASAKAPRASAIATR
jgi:hypothetical protein